MHASTVDGIWTSDTPASKISNQCRIIFVYLFNFGLSRPNMNCPNCGSPTLADQQFCRSCGAGLRADEPRPVNRRILWGLTMAFGGILIAMGGKMFDQRLVTFLGAFISIAGMFFIAAYPFIRPSRSQKHNAGLPSQPESLSPVETTKKLSPNGDIDFVASVTEETTNLLKVPASDPLR